MEKTAVEWLVQLLNKQGFAQVVTDEEIEQAKEMEKQQMCKFAYKCHNHYKVNGYFKIEDYYNQTFKQD